MGERKSIADIKSKAAVTLLGEVSEAELTVRLIEAHGGIRRPAGMSAEQAIATMPAVVQESARNQARAAVAYMAECFANSVQPS